MSIEISKENALKAMENIRTRKVNVLETIENANPLNKVWRWHMITPIDSNNEITGDHEALITRYKFDLPHISEENYRNYIRESLKDGLFISLFKVEEFKSNSEENYYNLNEDYFDQNVFTKKSGLLSRLGSKSDYFHIKSTLEDIYGEVPRKYALKDNWQLNFNYGIVITQDENGYSYRFGMTVIDDGQYTGRSTILYFDFDDIEDEPGFPTSLNNPVTQLIILLMEDILVFDDLKEFEKLNTTTDSIYDLGDLDVLIVLKDGTNLISWEDVEDNNDIIYLSEDLSDCTDLSDKYSGLKSLKAIVPYGVTDKVTNMYRMFQGCKSLVDISYLSNWGTSKVTDMAAMFEGCQSLVDISPLKDWDTSNVTDMSAIFNNCISLYDISPLKDWDTSKVTDMSAVFYHCISLYNIAPVSNWDVSSVEAMNAMFRVCLSLTDASPLDNWNIGENVEGWGMLSQCPLEKTPKWYVEPKGDVGIFE